MESSLTKGKHGKIHFLIGWICSQILHQKEEKESHMYFFFLLKTYKEEHFL